MQEVKSNKDLGVIEKLLKLSLTEVINFLIYSNNKSKSAKTGFVMDTGTHQIHLMIIRKPTSKSN